MKTSLLITLLVIAGAPLANASPITPAIDQAKAALQKGDLVAAETLLTPHATGEKPDAAACHQLGLVRQRQRRANEAVALHEQATKLEPTKPDYFSALGVAISESMREATFGEQAMRAVKMKKAFARSVELDANHVPGLIGLARFYAHAPEIAGGSLEQAADYARRVEKLHPFLGALELAVVAERADDFAGALGHYETALRLQPKSAGTLASAGRMLAKLGRTEDARNRFEAALQLDPAREAARKALADLPPVATSAK
jgi:Flp pilus assembly protein TadD